jgi:hypothetical protein
MPWQNSVSKIVLRHIWQGWRARRLDLIRESDDLIHTALPSFIALCAIQDLERTTPREGEASN